MFFTALLNNAFSESGSVSVRSVYNSLNSGNNVRGCDSASRANGIWMKMRTRCYFSEGEKSTKVSEYWARRVTYKEMLVTIALV